MDGPRLIGAHGGSNLVAWDGRVWLVPQALGPTEIDNAAHRARPGVTPYPNEAAARETAPAPANAPAGPAPAGPGGREFPITWWEETGRHTAFDDSGIASCIYRNLTTGEERSTPDLPLGACWASLRDYYQTGADGRTVWCKTPGKKGSYHLWNIDGRCSNCPMPDDKAHRCWVRHGTVGQPITVDKNGHTCAAGGGSISVDGFHGMLTGGALREC